MIAYSFGGYCGWSETARDHENETPGRTMENAVS